MSLADARKKFIELSELRRSGQAPKKIIQTQNEKKNDTVEKLVNSWYHGYVVKNRKKPFQIKQQIEADITPLLGHVELDKPLDENALPRAIRRIQKRVGIPEWTAHDLRRTFATQLGETLNVDPVVIEKCLGHKMPRIMATYNKNEMLPQRKEALEKWSQCIQNLIVHDETEPHQEENRTECMLSEYN